MRFPPIAIITTTLILSLGAFSIVVGQRVGASGTVKETSPAPSGGATPSRRTSVPVKIVTKYVPRPVTATTGRLFVSAEPNAVLLVEAIGTRNGQAQQGTVPSGRRDFIFNDLKPGRYRVAGTLAGYYQEETEVGIEANNSKSVTLNFRPVLYSVTINTNVNTGELKYGTDGQPLSNVVSIKNRSVRLNLPEGKYVVEITPGEFGYETLRQTFSLTSDQAVLDLPLKRIVLTTDTLSPTWTGAELQAWEMPAGWKADSKKNLLLKGPGVAFPRDESYRYYKDFRLSSSVKMMNGVAVSFALRARDSQNYYLLQLTGQNADEPYMARLFIVKDGVERRIRAIPVSRSGAAAMGSGQFFAVSIKMVDFAITVEIEDSQTGAPYTLGVLTDPDRNFAVGAVGIAARQNEENVIGRFVACTGEKCLSE